MSMRSIIIYRSRIGARYWDIKMRMTPDVAGPSLPVDPPFPSDPVEAGPSWWDYFIGIDAIFYGLMIGYEFN